MSRVPDPCESSSAIPSGPVSDREPAGLSGPASIAPRARIWLVDDSPLQVEITRAALATHHGVVVFDSASPMLERLSLGERPDLLMLDWHMPEVSGLEACRSARSLADDAELPIVILTATGRQSDMLEGLDAGANEFLLKPFDTAELHARVAALLRTKRLHAKLALVHSKLTLTEAALRAEASFREQFLAILAHDLRQPLNIFSLGSETLAAPSTSQTIRDKVAAQFVNASGRMQRMIGELLDFSRSRPAGGMPIVVRATDLAVVARNVVEELQLAHPARAIELAIEGTPAGAWDADRLAQVVSNLLENALAHSPRDSVVRIVIAERLDHVELVVENQGPPIAPGLLPTIFDAFRRGSAPRRARGGLGLGLFIVAQVVKSHGGTVAVRSDAAGTRFDVKLPFSVSREEPSQPTES